MTDQPTTPIDKSTWGDGPWQSEPDRVEWEHAGLPCLARRSPMGGNWCGYAAVPPGHPLHGKHYADVDVRVHGGLTYGSACDGEICHVPKPGEPEEVFWFGFDCGHFTDFMPAMDAFLRGERIRDRPAYDHAAAIASEGGWHEVYRTLDDVQAETNRLAEQLAAAAQTQP
jgi:hypothetical protein